MTRINKEMPVNKVEAVKTEGLAKVKVEGLRGLRAWPCSFLIPVKFVRVGRALCRCFLGWFCLLC